MSADGVGCGTGSDGCWHHELSYASLESTDSGYTQQPWLPDELVTKCMLCQQPFGMWRWSHHCRDCGGCFCRECTRHRVDSLSKDGPATLRLCDRCAFSSAHPEHLGCECAPTTTLRTMPTPRITWSSHTLPNAHRRPLQCSRCSLPRTERQLCVYVLLVLRVAACATCASCGSGTPAAKTQAPPPPPVSRRYGAGRRSSEPRSARPARRRGIPARACCRRSRAGRRGSRSRASGLRSACSRRGLRCAAPPS